MPLHGAELPEHRCNSALPAATPLEIPVAGHPDGTGLSSMFGFLNIAALHSHHQGEGPGRTSRCLRSPWQSEEPSTSLRLPLRRLRWQ